MPIPISIWVAAAVAAVAGYAAVRSAKRPPAHDAAPQRPEPLTYPRLTFKEFCARHLGRFADAAAHEPVKARAAGRTARRDWTQVVNAGFFPLCALAFAAAWLFGHELLRLLSVSAMIGYGTNWLAITMLFHPHRRRVVLGQGVIPKRREEIVEAIADGVFRNLINEEIIRAQLERSGLVQRITADFHDELHERLSDPAFRRDLKLLVETYFRDLSQAPEHRERLLRLTREMLDRLELNGIAGRLITLTRPVWQSSVLEEIERWIERDLPGVLNRNLDLLDAELAKLPGALERERAAIESWLTGAIVYFVKRLDLRKTILEQLRTFDEARVERLIRDAANDQLGTITLLGGILGIFAGFIMWRPVAILWLGAGALFIFGLDWLLTRLGGIRRRPAAT